MTPLTERFVLHFGEMGSRWGINRTVSQIYALLFLAKAPLNADDIAEELAFSRSNVSMGLKELQSWRLVKLSHRSGDRREYFSTPGDVWEIFRTLAEERKRREIDPTLSLLRDALVEKVGNDADRHAQERMRAMHELIELASTWFGNVQNLERGTVERLMKLGSGVVKLLEAKDKLKFPAAATARTQAKSKRS